MTLKNQILEYFESKGRSVTLNDLYDSFTKHKKPTVRARVYESLGSGIIRLDKGLYISAKAIVEHGNSLKVIDRLIDSKEKFDFIFLDIPYLADGQRSGPNGNRNLFPLDMITPGQFKPFIQKCENLLRTKDSTLMFMFTDGKSSKESLSEYLKCFESTSLKRCDTVGTYTKLWQNGSRMNMGKHLMPKENIYIFNQSGRIEDLNNKQLHYALTPDFKYPTSKPLQMIKSLIRQFTKCNEWILDPFGGSGKSLQASLELNRNCHIIDSSHTAFKIQKDLLLFQQLTLFKQPHIKATHVACVVTKGVSQVKPMIQFCGQNGCRGRCRFLF